MSSDLQFQCDVIILCSVGILICVLLAAIFQEFGWIACAIGDDDLDYEPLLRDTKFDGVFLIEYEPLEDPLEGIRRSLDYLHRIVENVRFE